MEAASSGPSIHCKAVEWTVVEMKSLRSAERLTLPDRNFLLISNECSDPRSVMVNLSKPLVAGQTPPAFLQKLAPGSPEDSS